MPCLVDVPGWLSLFREEMGVEWGAGGGGEGRWEESGEGEAGETAVEMYYVREE